MEASRVYRLRKRNKFELKLGRLIADTIKSSIWFLNDIEIIRNYVKTIRKFQLSGLLRSRLDSSRAWSILNEYIYMHALQNDLITGALLYNLRADTLSQGLVKDMDVLTQYPIPLT